MNVIGENVDDLYDWMIKSMCPILFVPFSFIRKLQLNSHKLLNMNVDTQKLGIPHLLVNVDEDQIQNGAMEILKVLRPDWEKNKISFKLLTDGITNKLVGCRHDDLEEEEIVLVRVYGNKTDLLIDRKAETRNIIILNQAGLAPQLYATFENGLAYRYIPGNTLNGETVRNPIIYTLVAKRMAKLHQIGLGCAGSPKPMIWDKVRKFLDLVPDVFTDPIKEKRHRDIGTSKSKIEEELEELTQNLLKLDSPIVFAHNDLLLGNVIYTEKTNCVTFIDYEYAAFNYQAFDIANHFNEFVGLENIDYSNYPNKEMQLEWLKIYLTEFNGNIPFEETIETLYVQVNQFALLSHIFWGIWALIQAEHSDINFDYLGYASIRFNEYFQKKEEFLSLTIPS